MTPEELKEQLSKLTLKELIERLAHERQTLDDYQSMAKAQQALYDYMSKVAVPDRMEEEGFDQITIEGIGRINIRSDMYVSTLKERRQDLYEWLSEHGLGDLITETVNSSTLKAWVKEQYKKGAPVPEDLLSITPYDRAVITKR